MKFIKTKNTVPEYIEVPLKQAPKLLSYRIANLQGQGKRPYQEDSFSITNAFEVAKIKQKGILLIVADGMGGLEDGKAVSSGAISGITRRFEYFNPDGDIVSQLRSIVMDSCDEVYSTFGGVGGSTLVLCYIFNQKLYWISIGDSYIFLIRNGGIYRLNRSHNSQTDETLENIQSGMMEYAYDHDDRDGDRLTEFVGKMDINKIDISIRPLKLLNGDSLILCSDGVGTVVPEDYLYNCVSSNISNRACELINQKVNEINLNHQDNYTAIVTNCIM